MQLTIRNYISFNTNPTRSESHLKLCHPRMHSSSFLPQYNCKILQSSTFHKYIYIILCMSSIETKTLTMFISSLMSMPPMLKTNYIHPSLITETDMQSSNIHNLERNSFSASCGLLFFTEFLKITPKNETYYS